jgi:hypothetical protein
MTARNATVPVATCLVRGSSKAASRVRVIVAAVPVPAALTLRERPARAGESPP